MKPDLTGVGCAYCGQPAYFISVNSRTPRCEGKVTRCPGFVAKALAARGCIPKHLRPPKPRTPRKPHSEETKQRMKEAAAKRDNSNIGKYKRTEEHRKRLREEMYNKLESGKMYPVRDTRPEREFEQYLNDANIGYKKQFVIQFGRIGIDRFRHAYDFHILDTNILVEIDGDYWHSRSGAAERDAECERVAAEHGFHVIRIRDLTLTRNIDFLKSLW